MTFWEQGYSSCKASSTQTFSAATLASFLQKFIQVFLSDRLSSSSYPTTATVDSFLCYSDMGRKIVAAYVSLNIAAVLFEVIAASMTWHSTRVMLIGATIFRMKAGLLTASIDEGASLLCKFAPEKYCEALEDGITLRDAAQQWCANAIVNFGAGPCHAFSSAFYMGLFVTFTLVVNIIVLAVSCWLLYRYAVEEKHKPIYRQFAVVMHILATFAMLTVTIMYYLLAGQQLDNILSEYMPTGSGTGYGQIMFMVAILVQAAAAAMTNCVAMGDEQTEEDYIASKMRKEKMRDYGAFAKGFSTQDGDAERGYNQAFTNGPTHQPNFVPVQQDWVQPGFAPALSPQPLTPQPAYMAQQAVAGQPVITAAVSYAGAPAQAVPGPPVMSATISYAGAAAW